MPYFALSEEQIEEGLLLEYSDEEELSEIEDNEEYSEHESNSEQEGEDIPAFSEEINCDDSVLPRRDYLKELALSLVMPQIRVRSTVQNLSSYIKGKIMFVLSGNNEIIDNPSRAQQERVLQPRSQMSASRCTVCPWKKDRKTKTDCNFCHKIICKEHTVPICEDCPKKNCHVIDFLDIM
ncbi:hypothetical protein ACJJTC_013102 [Scirpophaga incertulas]